MSNPTDPAAEAQHIVDALRAGGATALQVTAPPLWIIGQAPSGQCFQLVWWTGRGAYEVTRRPPGQPAPDVLGTFPDWETAVACALRA